MDVSTAARHHMIDGQLEPNQVQDERVVAAMGISPRERFVPEGFENCAYVDDNIPFGSSRYLMRPLALGRMLQAAQIMPKEKALVIAGSTGYSALVMSHLGADVTVIEESGELANKARVILQDLGQQNISIRTAAQHQGCPESAPYDIILIDGAVEDVPQAILDQLSDSGRLITVRNKQLKPGEPVGMGEAIIIEKFDGQCVERALFDTAVPVLSAFRKDSGFVF
ncbi:MAG: protein-L-isoaspartate O-methyltransferase [Rickettsiales bacterium]|nr:protein-L-isoaspartate O-methyltransferase [Rickettsiales bacterium]